MDLASNTAQRVESSLHTQGGSNTLLLRLLAAPSTSAASPSLLLASLQDSKQNLSKEYFALPDIQEGFSTYTPNVAFTHKGDKARVIYPSASGRLFNQAMAYELSRESELLFICGHYEGLDKRIIDEYVDDEISIGDYVLTSGETSSIVIIDALFRLIDGVISSESLEDESFSSSLLEYDQYTRPERYCNSSVPDVLLSGNHALICSWRDQNRLAKTMRSRPDMLSEASLSLGMRRKLIKVIEEFGIEDL